MPRLILVIDDSPSNFELLNEVLGDAYDVRFALSGPEALGMVREDVFDIILLDVMMPGMDGYEVCARLKADPVTEPIPVIFVTAMDEFEDEMKGLELGAIDYLTKPINPGIVRARIRNHVNLLEAREELLVRFSELEASKRELEKLDHEKNKLFSIIAHDLRGPFTALLGLSGFMAQGVMKLSLENLIDYSGRINGAAQRVFRLLENLLEWAQIQMNGECSEPQEFNLQSLTEEMLALLRPMAEEKGVVLCSHLEDRRVTADPNLLGIAIRNLLHNAIKFTPPGGRVEVNLREVDRELRLAVTDTGVGMSSEKLASLFHLGESVSERGTDGEKGTGLGLILTKDLIEKNGGRIDVQSVEGRGTTFLISLPQCVKVSA